MLSRLFACCNKKDTKEPPKIALTHVAKNHYSFSFAKKKKEVTHSKYVTIATAKKYPNEDSESLSWKLP